MSKLIETLRRHEGVEKYVYKDHLGYDTIGVGRLVQADIGLGLSDDEIDYLLQNDIDRVEKELVDSFDWFVELDPVREEACINMCCNLGLTRYKGFSRALAAMARHDYEDAADEFMDSLWARQVGDRAVEVTEMIRTGEYQ